MWVWGIVKGEWWWGKPGPSFYRSKEGSRSVWEFSDEIQAILNFDWLRRRLESAQKPTSLNLLKSGDLLLLLTVDSLGLPVRKCSISAECCLKTFCNFRMLQVDVTWSCDTNGFHFVLLFCPIRLVKFNHVTFNAIWLAASHIFSLQRWTFCYFTRGLWMDRAFQFNFRKK